MFKLKPALGLVVKDPKTLKPIPADGVTIKQMTTYWARRLAAGDVVKVEEKPQHMPTAPAEKSSKPKSGGEK